MSIPAKLAKFLKQNKVYYQVLVHPETFTACEEAEKEPVCGREVAKVVMAKAGRKDLMLVLPSTRTVDLLKLSAVTDSPDVRIEEEKEFTDLFPDCEPGMMPPFGKLYHLPCLIDESLEKAESIVFRGGSCDESVKVDAGDFFRVAKGRIRDFSVEGKKLTAA